MKWFHLLVGGAAICICKSASLECHFDGRAVDSTDADAVDRRPTFFPPTTSRDINVNQRMFRFFCSQFPFSFLFLNSGRHFDPWLSCWFDVVESNLGCCTRIFIDSIMLSSFSFVDFFFLAALALPAFDRPIALLPESHVTSWQCRSRSPIVGASFLVLFPVPRCPFLFFTGWSSVGEFYWAWLGFSGFYWVLLSLIRFHWVLLGFIGFY